MPAPDAPSPPDLLHVRGSRSGLLRQQLPPGVRKDAADLPQYTGKMRNYRDALKLRAEQDERRLFYVALTRARKTVTLTWPEKVDRRSREMSPR